MPFCCFETFLEKFIENFSFNDNLKITSSLRKEVLLMDYFVVRFVVVDRVCPSIVFIFPLSLKLIVLMV